MIVAIDGPAGSGKSSTARALASRLDLVYLDTGAMYRAVALLFLRNGIEPDDGNVPQLLEDHSIGMSCIDNTMRVCIDSEDVTSLIRTARVTELSSRVSTLPSVRRKLVAEQRRMAEIQLKSGRGVVMEGRDIGTVVFPAADIKFYLEANAEERARRRVLQIRDAKGDADTDQILKEIRARDERDSSRSVSPLVQAEDAIRIDTTTLSFTEQVDLMERLIRERRETG